LDNLEGSLLNRPLPAEQGWTSGKECAWKGGKWRDWHRLWGWGPVFVGG